MIDHVDVNGSVDGYGSFFFFLFLFHFRTMSACHLDCLFTPKSVVKQWGRTGENNHCPSLHLIAIRQPFRRTVKCDPLQCEDSGTPIQCGVPYTTGTFTLWATMGQYVSQIDECLVIQISLSWTTENKMV